MAGASQLIQIELGPPVRMPKPDWLRAKAKYAALEAQKKQAEENLAREVQAQKCAQCITDLKLEITGCDQQMLELEALQLCRATGVQCHSRRFRCSSDSAPPLGQWRYSDLAKSSALRFYRWDVSFKVMRRIDALLLSNVDFHNQHRLSHCHAVSI